MIPVGAWANKFGFIFGVRTTSVTGGSGNIDKSILGSGLTSLSSVYSSVEDNYATFVFAYVLQGKFIKTKETIDVSEWCISQNEFNKFTKAKQNKLLVEWELKALKQFIVSLFDNDDIVVKPTDFVYCEFEGMQTDNF